MRFKKRTRWEDRCEKRVLIFFSLLLRTDNRVLRKHTKGIPGPPRRTRYPFLSVLILPNGAVLRKTVCRPLLFVFERVHGRVEIFRIDVHDKQAVRAPESLLYAKFHDAGGNEFPAIRAGHARYS